MTFSALPCFKCGAKLEDVDPSDLNIDNHPYGGTVFQSHGHYGSTVFDPMNGDWLELNICDNCFRATATGTILRGKPDWSPQPPPSYTIWKRDDTQGSSRDSA